MGYYAVKLPYLGNTQTGLFSIEIFEMKYKCSCNMILTTSMTHL